MAAAVVLVLLFLETGAGPPADAASDELDVILRFLEAAAAAAASSSGKLMREKTLGLCFPSLVVVAAAADADADAATGLESEVGGGCDDLLVDDDSDLR